MCLRTSGVTANMSSHLFGVYLTLHCMSHCGSNSVEKNQIDSQTLAVVGTQAIHEHRQAQASQITKLDRVSIITASQQSKHHDESYTSL